MPIFEKRKFFGHIFSLSFTFSILFGYKNRLTASRPPGGIPKTNSFMIRNIDEFEKGVGCLSAA